MLRRLPQIYVQNLRQSVQCASQPQSREKWDLYAGVLVERLPVVSKTLNTIETNFQKLLWQIEFEKSFKSTHEITLEKDLQHAELLKKGDADIDLDEAITKQTAQDLEDAYIEEANKFKAAPRVTADDKTKNLQSPNRLLENTLYLLVEQEVGKRSLYMLPQGIRLDGETMRQAAERVLREHCGDKLNVTFFGNAPCGFYKYKYPSEAGLESIGAKVFFFRSILKSGSVATGANKKFEWLDQQSLGQRLNTPAYLQSVQKMLI